MSTDSTEKPAFFALFRGHDRQGVMQEAWRRLHENALTPEGAKEECAGLFGSGLLWHPLAAEFRVIAEDGTPLVDARPPHKDALHWGTPDISMTEFLNVSGNSSFSLPSLAFAVGHVVAGNG